MVPVASGAPSEETAAYVTDGYHHPPRGTQGGGPAAPSVAFKVGVDGREEELHPIARDAIDVMEKIRTRRNDREDLLDIREASPQ